MRRHNVWPLIMAVAMYAALDVKSYADQERRRNTSFGKDADARRFERRGGSSGVAMGAHSAKMAAKRKRANQIARASRKARRRAGL